MKLGYLVGCLAYLMVTTVMADDTLQPLFDFTEADAAKESGDSLCQRVDRS